MFAQRLPTSKVCFEITEMVAAGSLDDVVEFMERMKIIGVSFSLDDFGAGLSSYSYLRNLPVDYHLLNGQLSNPKTYLGKQAKSSLHDRKISSAINPPHANQQIQPIAVIDPPKDHYVTASNISMYIYNGDT